jgi:nucleotide-binding universal stress UspA family protein
MYILLVFHEMYVPDKVLEFCTQFVTPAEIEVKVLLAPRTETDKDLTKPIYDRVTDHFQLQESAVDVKSGDIVAILDEEFSTNKYDLAIVYPFRTHSRWTKILHRSTPVQTVQVANCPILFPKGNLRPVQRILVCDSGAQESKPLSTYTSKIANLLSLEEEITVLHVMSQITAGPGVRGKQLRMEADELIETRSPEGSILEQDIKIIESVGGVHPTAKVRHGIVEEEILIEARTGDYDLVVIGAHRSQGWQRFLLDDLAKKIMFQLDRPVLVVK